MHNQACSCVFILLNVKWIIFTEIGLIFFFQWNLIQHKTDYLGVLFIFPHLDAHARKGREQSENTGSKIDVL